MILIFKSKSKLIKIMSIYLSRSKMVPFGAKI